MNNHDEKKMTEDIEFIKGKMLPAEILAQLAEKAAELGQAALKLRRAILGTNPTPISEEEAKRQLLEAHKHARWVRRLKAAGRKSIVEAGAGVVTNNSATYQIGFNGDDETELTASGMEDLKELWESLCPEFGCEPNSVDYVIRVD